MVSPIYELTGLPQFVNLVLDYKPSVWIFRGQADEKWSLLPKAGRRGYFVKFDAEIRREHGRLAFDLEQFEKWRSQAIAFSPNVPDDALECLAYAQHYGLATRLLDWTKNPMVALYFAVEACTCSDSADGVVYAYLKNEQVDLTLTDISLQSQIAIYHPRTFDRRILAQAAAFTFHPEPELELKPEKVHPRLEVFSRHECNLIKFVIPNSLKFRILDDLSRIGVDRKCLFPDLHGLSASIDWETRAIVAMKK